MRANAGHGEPVSGGQGHPHYHRHKERDPRDASDQERQSVGRRTSGWIPVRTTETTSVFIPKCRRKVLYGSLRQHLGEVFRQLAEQRESRILEGHLLSDHVHMTISIPPKYAVSKVVGYIKGKSAIHLARVYGERKQNYAGQSFWARGYFVSTVGRDETTIREYIRNQEKEDQRLDQMNMWQ